MSDLERIPDDEGLVDEALEMGAAIASGMAGAGLGAIVAGPPGALAGAVAGPPLQRAIVGASRWMRDRFGKGAQRRWGAVLVVALPRILAGIEEGATPRADMTEEDPTGRSGAEELLEATYRAAVDEHEELKIPWLGNMYASFVFAPPWVTRDTMNYNVRIARQLSWRQLRLLRGAHKKVGITPDLAAPVPGDADWRLQVDGLVGLGLARRGEWFFGPPRPPEHSSRLGLLNEGRLFEDVRFTYAARLLAALMDLDEMPEDVYFAAFGRPMSDDEPESP